MQFLQRFALWFVSGVAASLGVGAVVTGSQFLKPYVFPPPSVIVPAPPELSVTNVEPILITQSPGVTARVSNGSASQTLQPAMYELLFLSDGKQLFSCEIYRERPTLQPGASASVQLVCPEVNQAALPASVQYKLRIRDAWRFK